MKIKRVLALLLALILTTTVALPASAANTNVSGWAQADVTEAAKAGIVPSDLPTDYTQPITRAQFCNLAVTLYEAVRGTPIMGRSDFMDTTDVNVQKMAYLGVVGGYGGGVFGPNDTLKREQAAAILSRLAGQLNISMRTAAVPYTDVATSWARDEIAKVYSIEVMTGTTPTTFDPSKHYTIEQSITTMLRLYKKATNANSPQESQPPVGNIVASGSDDNLTWTLDSNGLLTISGTGKMSEKRPWFSYRDQIKRIIIEEGVTSICPFAFTNHKSLTSISIAKSVSLIGRGAFSDCDSLTDATLEGAFTYTVNSPDDLKGFAETLRPVWPPLLGIYVPVEQVEQYKDPLLYCAMTHVDASETKTIMSGTIKGSDYALIIISYSYNSNTGDGMDILPYHQGYLNELDENSVALYEQAKAILSSIVTPGMSEYQKVKAIHDYIAKNTVYTMDFENMCSAKGPLLEGKGVCQGYCEAFQLLCVMSNIECLTVTGYANNWSHAWNKVKVDGVWYNVDVTWDDTTGGSVRYNYFLISDSKLAKDHKWGEGWIGWDYAYLPDSPVNYSK